MATRPTIPILVRASATNYTTGPPPLVATVTKIDPESTLPGQTIEGWKVDSPLGSFPIFAQWKNFFENRNDQWVEWVTNGSSAGAKDAHVVETDIDGRTTVAGATITGDVNRVGLTVSASTLGDQAMIVTGGNSDEAVSISPGTNQHALVISTVGKGNGNCIDLSPDSTGGGILINGTPDVGVTAFGTTTGGTFSSTTGDALEGICANGVALRCQSNGTGVPFHIERWTVEPSVFPESGGSMWSFDSATTNGDSIKCRLNNDIAYFHTSINKFAYCSVQSGAGTVVTVSPLFAETFEKESTPDAAIDVMVTASIIAEMTVAPSGDPHFGVITVNDDTGPGGPAIKSLFMHEDTGTASRERGYSWRWVYTLPAGGPRTFSAQLSATTGAQFTYTDLIITFETHHK